MDAMDLKAPRDRLLWRLRQDIHDERVLSAMARVPREHFVPPELRAKSYDDNALPIKHGQSISQPLIVALMTEALNIQPGDRVLEIGTGSGYQAAVLAEMGATVVTVERYEALADEAADRLRELGHHSVRVHLAREGVLGSPDGAPFDAILVAAAAPMVPQSLLDQLSESGRLVLPVGSREEQNLLLVTKRGDMIARKNLGACRFVPLVGAGAWPDAGPGA